MNTSALRRVPWGIVALVAAALLPLAGMAGVEEQLTTIIIYAILALGLNVVMGYTGLLHLGIAAFFGIGAYVTGILTVEAYPFQAGFIGSLVASIIVAAAFGLILGAPTLRLRGDYLAIVTLGFGEVVRYSLRNLEEITAGTRGLNPIPSPATPAWLAAALGPLGIETDWSQNPALFYLLTLGLLVLVIALLRNLERARLGRAWVAIREDELAAACTGIDVVRAKLAAFALAAAIAGMAGCLYATKLGNTANPDAYDFNRSIITLCCVILGGLGSIRGVVLGTLLLVGFDLVAAPMLDSAIQAQSGGSQVWYTFSNLKYMIFGLVLILMMRFRPEGLLPSVRVQRELRDAEPGLVSNPAGLK